MVEKNSFLIRYNSFVQKKLFFIFSLISLFCGSFVQAMTLHEAIESQNIEQMQGLLQARADINAPDENGWWPLHHAAESGFDEGLRLLLESCADVNATNKEQCTALHIASYYARSKAVEHLLESNASVGAEDQEGFTPLHLAASGGYTDIALHLFLHNADVNKMNLSGVTPLHDAAVQNCRDMARFLLYCGAHVDEQTENGNTPLHLAAERGHTSIAEALVDAGADIWRLNARQRTPLSMAGNIMLRNYLDRTQGATRLLFQAVGNGNLEEVQEIFRSGIFPQLNARDENGDTPLHLAIMRAQQGGNPNMVTYLLQFAHVLDFRKTNGSGQSLFNLLRDYALQTDPRLLKLLPNQGSIPQEEHIRTSWLPWVKVGGVAAIISVGTVIAWILLRCVRQRR